MAEISRQEGHLLVAAVRVLSHLRERSPRPNEVAELLELPPAMVRLQLSQLQELGIVALVESAFDMHVEIRAYAQLEELAETSAESGLQEDLADFDRRKQEESERMDRLFSEGEHQKKQAERIKKMDEELRDFRQRKPRDPFADS